MTRVGNGWTPCCGEFPSAQGRDPEAPRRRSGDRAPAVEPRRAAGRDQRPRKSRPPPEGSGGGSPTGSARAGP